MSVIVYFGSNPSSSRPVQLKQIHGEQCTYMAANCLKEVTAAGLTSLDSVLDYTAKQTPPGLPPHTLHIKVNGIYRLIHNFFVNRGLVKNAQVIVSCD